MEKYEFQNLKSLPRQSRKIIDCVIEALHPRLLEMLVLRQRNVYVEFKEQLLARYESQYPIHKLKNVRNRLKIFVYLLNQKPIDDINVTKSEIFKELDRYFSDIKPPNKFLKIFNQNQTFIATSISITAVLISIFKK